MGQPQHERPTLTAVEREELNELQKEFKVTWEWGEQDAAEVLDKSIAKYLNNKFGRTVLQEK